MSPWSWSCLGFAIGTAIVSSLVLSIDPWERLTPGLLLGGIPGGLVSYVIARDARDKRQRGESNRGA